MIALLPLLSALAARDDGGPAGGAWSARLDPWAACLPAGEIQYEGPGGDFLFRINAGAFGRGTLPLGWVEDARITRAGDVYYIEEHLRYLDLFKPGLGLSLEADAAVGPGAYPGEPLHAQTPAMGIYAAFHMDRFGGDGARDSEGNLLRPDDLAATSVVAGFKAAGTVFERHYGELKAGIGWLRYDAVRADFRAEAGGSFEGELLEKSDSPVFELRLRYGYRLGPLAFLFGFGLRVADGPDPGRDAAVSIDPGPLFLLDIELGIQAGF